MKVGSVFSLLHRQTGLKKHGGTNRAHAFLQGLEEVFG